MKKYFFDSWENKTELERKAVESFKVGLNLILKTIPREEIVAIYIKGSFLTRELNDRSDVDFITVLRTTRYIKRLKDLNLRYRTSFNPQLQLNPCYSLWELRTGKKRKVHPPNQAPGGIVNHLDRYALVYGTALVKRELKERAPEKDLVGLAKFLLKDFIPELEKKERGEPARPDAGLSSLVKATLWLTESELRAKGISYDYSYKGIESAVRDPKHIVHEAYRLRMSPTKDKRIRKAFIENVKKYSKEVLRNYETE